MWYKNVGTSFFRFPINHAFVRHTAFSWLDRVACNACSAVTRNSSGDEIANVNFLYDDIVHVLQNTIDSCINSATDRQGCVGTHVHQIL